LELRPDDDALRELVESERDADPVNAAREYDCEWISAGEHGAVFGDDVLTQCTVNQPTNLEPEPLDCFGGIDLAFTGDGSALAIIRKRPTGDLELCALKRWRPRKGEPLRPSVVISEAFDTMERHGCHLVFADSHHFATLLEHASERKGIHIKKAPPGAAGKARTHADAVDVMTSGRFAMGADRQLLKSLRRVTATRAPSGETKITTSRRKGDHGDDASALVLALHAAHERAGRTRDRLPSPRRSPLESVKLGIVDRQSKHEVRIIGGEAILVPRHSARAHWGDRHKFNSGGF